MTCRYTARPAHRVFRHDFISRTESAYTASDRIGAALALVIVAGGVWACLWLVGVIQ